MTLEDKTVNQTKMVVLDTSWNFFPFDQDNDLNCGTFEVMFGWDDRLNLDEFVDTFPYDGKSFLSV